MYINSVIGSIWYIYRWCLTTSTMESIVEPNGNSNIFGALGPNIFTKLHITLVDAPDFFFEDLGIENIG